jgi:hypothetical protein
MTLTAPDKLSRIHKQNYIESSSLLQYDTVSTGSYGVMSRKTWIFQHRCENLKSPKTKLGYLEIYWLYAQDFGKHFIPNF